MKKLFNKAMFAFSLFSMLLASCGASNSGSSLEEDPRYAIYQLAVQDGYSGTYQEWLDSIKGKDGADGKDGVDGKDGQDGHTPVINIGENGNWFIDGVDTGVKARGENGQDGKDGVDGKDGTDGTNGENGKDGTNGVDGKDGTSLLNGNGTPETQLGKVGDTYIDLNTWDVYTKTSEGWTIVGNIKGLNGKDGKDGTDGTNGENGKDGLTPYIGENGHWWIGENDTGLSARGENGQDGQNGQDGKDGQNGVTPHIGDNGNWFIGNVDTNIPATGPKGDNGADGKDGVDGKDGKDGVDGKDGAGIITGSGEPILWYPDNDPSIPNGTLYLDTGSGDLYKYFVNSTDPFDAHWYPIGNIKGADGKDGTNGQNGKDGVDGKDGQNGQDGKDGQDGVTPHIGYNGNWWIGENDTGTPATGQDGLTPYIGDNGHWWIGENDTGVSATGPKGDAGADGKDGKDGTNGQDGQNGQDGLTPYIGDNGNWWIGDLDTGVKAQGQRGDDGNDGLTPYIGADGYWYIGGVCTGVSARGADGQNGRSITSVSDMDVTEAYTTYRITYSDGTYTDFTVFNGHDGKDGQDGQNGQDGAPGAHVVSVTLYSTSGSVREYEMTFSNGSKFYFTVCDGERGDKGDKGDTAYSNTILPTNYGYVTCNVGSAIVGEDVTFTFVAENHHHLSSVYLNQSYYSPTDAGNNTYTLTVPMVEGGYVVKATFVKDEVEVIYKDDVFENELGRGNTYYGEEPRYSPFERDPEIPDDEEHSYEFIGWDEIGFTAEGVGIKYARFKVYSFKLNPDGSSYSFYIDNRYTDRFVGHLDIPSYHMGLPVTVIDEKDGDSYGGALNGCKKVTSIRIPETVTTIGERALSGISAKHVDIPDSVTTYKNSRLYLSDKTETVRLSRSVNQLQVLSGGLVRLEVPENYEEIYQINCGNLRELVLGKNTRVTSIYQCYDLVNLASIKIDQNNPYYTVENNVLYNKDMSELILYPIGLNNPSTNNVYTMPTSVTSIHFGAFSFNRYLKVINLSPNISGEINSYSFSNSKSLEEINIDESNTNYYTEDGVLYRRLANSELGLIFVPCAIEEYEFKASVTKLDANAFVGSHLKNLVIPDTVSNSQEYSISSLIDGSLIENITIGKNLNLSTFINLFSSAKQLKSITVSDEHPNFTSIDGVLYNKDVTELVSIPAKYENEYVVPDSVTSFRGVQYPSTLKSIVFGEGISTFNTRMISNCDSLEEIHFKGNLVKMTQDIFFECHNIKDVYYEGTYAEWQALEIEFYWLYNCNYGIKLHCSDQTVNYR